MIYHTPIPLLAEIIDGDHFVQLQAADDAGMLPDEWEKINALANVIAYGGMNRPQEPLDLRPKLKELSDEAKPRAAKQEATKRKSLTWRTSRP